MTDYEMLSNLVAIADRGVEIATALDGALRDSPLFVQRVLAAKILLAARRFRAQMDVGACEFAEAL